MKTSDITPYIQAHLKRTLKKDILNSSTKLVEGAYLCTLNSQQLTNAILYKIDKDIYTIITDFGNVLYLTKDQVSSHYEVSNSWVEGKALDYPFDSVKQRLELQILKLQEVLRDLD